MSRRCRCCGRYSRSRVKNDGRRESRRGTRNGVVGERGIGSSGRRCGAVSQRIMRFTAEGGGDDERDDAAELALRWILGRLAFAYVVDGGVPEFVAVVEPLGRASMSTVQCLLLLLQAGSVHVCDLVSVVLIVRCGRGCLVAVVAVVAVLLNGDGSRDESSCRGPLLGRRRSYGCRRSRLMLLPCRSPPSCSSSLAMGGGVASCSCSGGLNRQASICAVRGRACS